MSNSYTGNGSRLRSLSSYMTELELHKSAMLPPTNTYISVFWCIRLALRCNAIAIPFSVFSAVDIEIRNSNLSNVFLGLSESSEECSISIVSQALCWSP